MEKRERMKQNRWEKCQAPSIILKHFCLSPAPQPQSEIWVDLVEEVVGGVNQGRMDGEPLERSSVEA